MRKAVMALAGTVFVLLAVSFITLTLIGIFFRGEGMALVFPWM